MVTHILPATPPSRGAGGFFQKLNEVKAHRPTAPLLPGVDQVRAVSLQVARQVIRAAVEEGVATQLDVPSDDADLEEWIGVQMWHAEYRPLKKVSLEASSREARGELRKAGTVDRAP